jgi:hypothetical protein
VDLQGLNICNRAHADELQQLHKLLGSKGQHALTISNGMVEWSYNHSPGQPQQAEAAGSARELQQEQALQPLAPQQDDLEPGLDLLGSAAATM